MPTFEYMAQTLGGASDTGVITAQSRVEAIHQLRDLRLTPVSLQEVKEAKRVWGKRIPKGALANCYVALADLLESGMPLLKTLDVVAAQLSRSDLPFLSRNFPAGGMGALSRGFRDIPNWNEGLAKPRVDPWLRP